MGESVTLQTRVLGARNATTNWPAVTFTTSTIKAMVRPMGQTPRDTPEGRIFENRARIYTYSAIVVKDRVTYNGLTWEVEDVQYKHPLLGVTGYYHATIIQLNA